MRPETSHVQQLTFDLGHRAAQGREDFLISSANEQAVQWIDLWPDWNACALIVYGPAACGKSHLSAVWANMADAHIVTPDNLINLNADELSKRSQHLVIENLDVWAGDKEIETKLFHLYNIVKSEERSLFLTMRVAPTHLQFALPDLASRLRSVPAVAISPPDDGLLTALLVKLFSDRQLMIGEDALKYIIPRIERSFMGARNIVERADQKALAEKRPVSIPLLRQILIEEIS